MLLVHKVEEVQWDHKVCLENLDPLVMMDELDPWVPLDLQESLVLPHHSPHRL